jgi:hypothetical protein
MATTEKAILPNGNVWYIAARIENRGEILIPADQLGDMSDAEIGRFVRILSNEARALGVTHTIEFYHDDDPIELLDKEIENLRQFGYEHTNKYESIKYLEDYKAELLKPKPQLPASVKKEKRKRSGFVYLIKSEAGHYKIGRTTNIADRAKVFGVKLPFDIEIEHTIVCSDYVKAEQHLHEKFSAKRGQGEWFTLSEEDVAYIKSLERLDL